MLQLSPPIPLSTPKGEGLAVMVIDYGVDFDLWWTVIISKGEHAGEIWTYANPEVRGVENVTLGRHDGLGVSDGKTSPRSNGNRVGIPRGMG